MDEKIRTELEAAVFRRLVDHLRARTDVQNIDLMNLAGFCRNCLSNWLKEAADAKGVPLTKDESRAEVYGMPYEEWKAKYQREATPEQQAAFRTRMPLRTSTEAPISPPLVVCYSHRKLCVDHVQFRARPP